MLAGKLCGVKPIILAVSPWNLNSSGEEARGTFPSFHPSMLKEWPSPYSSGYSWNSLLKPSIYIIQCVPQQLRLSLTSGGLSQFPGVVVVSDSRGDPFICRVVEWGYWWITVVFCVRDESNSEDKWLNCAPTENLNVATLDHGGWAAGSYLSALSGHYSPCNSRNSHELSIMRIDLLFLQAVFFFFFFSFSSNFCLICSRFWRQIFSPSTLLSSSPAENLDEKT